FVGVDQPVRRHTCCFEDQALRAHVDAPGAAGEHLDHQHGRMAKVVEAELGPAGDEDVGLENGVLARDVVDGGYENLVLRGRGVRESYEESPDNALVGDLWRRGHDERAVDELVAMTVV